MYWVSNISSWSYIDINSKSHGRIDWFEDIRDMGYWWQTAHENGVCFTIENAKREVEEALWRRCMVLAALYMENVDEPTVPHTTLPVGPMGDTFHVETSHEAVHTSAYRGS